MNIKKTNYLIATSVAIVIAATLFILHFNTKNSIIAFINDCTEKIRDINLLSHVDDSMFSGSDNKYYLIYCYDNRMCKPCIISDLDKIRSGFTGVPSEKWLIIVRCNNTKEDRIMLMNELHDLNYIELSRNQLELPIIDNMPQRFYAQLNKSGKIVKALIPNDNPEYEDYFFRLISNEIVHL